jgi:hypothetical protein
VSVALNDFKVSLKQTEALIAREKRFDDPPHPRSEDAVLALRGAATVLMVATFERFLRDVVAEQVGKLATRPPPLAFADLPEKLRTSSVFVSLERAMRGRHAGLPSGQIHRLPLVRSAASRFVEGLVDPRALSETGGNAGAETVKELFRNLGVQDVFGRIRPDFEAAWGRPESTDFVPSKLEEIVNSRHRVAHRADALSISRVQLGEWPRFLSTLAAVLDTALDQYVDDVINRRI